MDRENLKEAVSRLAVLKKDTQECMKKGLPFVLASVAIWVLILIVQFLNLDISAVNMCTFCCCVLLMPFAILFAKLVKADIFRKTVNPLNRLALLNTLNQFLYILIVMWAFSRAPEYMVMIYAMVFGAHLLPFSWVYDSKPYMVFAIIETIAALAVSLFFPNIVLAAFMVIMQAILSLLLFFDMRKAEKTSESRNNN